MWVEELVPELMLIVVPMSGKAVQRRLGWKGLVHLGYTTAGAAGAGVGVGVGVGMRNMIEVGEAAEERMVGVSATELMVEGEELQSTVAEAVESRYASEAEPFIMLKRANSRVESTEVVAVVVQQRIGCSGAGLRVGVVGIAAGFGEDAQSERMEGVVDNTEVVGVVVVVKVEDIAVAVAVNKVAGEEGAAVVVVYMGVVAVEAGCCAVGNTVEARAEPVISKVRWDIGCTVGGAR